MPSLVDLADDGATPWSSRCRGRRRFPIRVPSRSQHPRKREKGQKNGSIHPPERERNRKVGRSGRREEGFEGGTARGERCPLHVLSPYREVRFACVDEAEIARWVASVRPRGRALLWLVGVALAVAPCTGAMLFARPAVVTQRAASRVSVAAKQAPLPPTPRPPSRRRCVFMMTGGIVVYWVLVCRTPGGAAVFNTGPPTLEAAAPYERLVGAIGACKRVSVEYPGGDREPGYVCPDSVTSRVGCDHTECGAFDLVTDPEWCRIMTSLQDDGIFEPCSPASTKTKKLFLSPS